MPKNLQDSVEIKFRRRRKCIRRIALHRTGDSNKEPPASQPASSLPVRLSPPGQRPLPSHSSSIVASAPATPQSGSAKLDPHSDEILDMDTGQPNPSGKPRLDVDLNTLRLVERGKREGGGWREMRARGKGDCYILLRRWEGGRVDDG